MKPIGKEPNNSFESIVLDSFKENSSLDKLTSESIDITLPGGQVTLGTLHPVSSAIRDISKFFTNFHVII